MNNIFSLRFWVSLVLCLSLMNLSYAEEGAQEGEQNEPPEPFETRAEVKAWVQEIVAEESELDYDFAMALMKEAKPRPTAVQKTTNSAETVLTWERYQGYFLPELTNPGVDFFETHYTKLLAAHKKYHVPLEVIVAIIGIETRFGNYTGSYRVIDSLSTLAFDGPQRRRGFFKKELMNFMLILKRMPHLDVKTIKGSYAGAMGWSQFMPSSYLHYAADGDGVIDIWNSLDDVIFSTARYLSMHGWKKDEPYWEKAVVRTSEANISSKLKIFETIPKRDEYKDMELRRAQKGGFRSVRAFSPKIPAALIKLPLNEENTQHEYWFVFENYYAISRYNPRFFYASAVSKLAYTIRESKDQKS